MPDSENKDLQHRIRDASILLWDWDGFYNPASGSGNPRGMAAVIEEAYILLQGRSWRAVDGGRQDKPEWHKEAAQLASELCAGHDAQCQCVPCRSASMIRRLVAGMEQADLDLAMYEGVPGQQAVDQEGR